MTQQLNQPRKKEPQISSDVSDTNAPAEQRGRQGFLPMETNAFDRGFIGVVLLIAIHLLWMRFLEAYLPLWIATVLSVGLLIAIIRWG